MELLSFTSNEEGQRCGCNHYYSISNMFEETHQQISQLWAFAYDMDNMKARCWYANNFLFSCFTTA